MVMVMGLEHGFSDDEVDARNNTSSNWSTQDIKPPQPQPQPNWRAVEGSSERRND